MQCGVVGKGRVWEKNAWIQILDQSLTNDMTLNKLPSLGNFLFKSLEVDHRFLDSRNGVLLALAFSARHRAWFGIERQEALADLKQADWRAT